MTTPHACRVARSAEVTGVSLQHAIRAAGLAPVTPVSPCDTRRTYSFTLIELLVVIAIIAILASMLMPALRGAQEHAVRVSCMNNLRQVAIATTSYADEWNDSLPPVWRTASSFTTYWMRVTGVPCGLGLLESQKYLTEAAAFYCPAQERNALALLRYNITENPWAAADCRSSYRARLFRTSGVPLKAAVWGNWRLKDYPRLVIFTDYTGVDGYAVGTRYIMIPHQRQGCNRLFGDGAAAWTPLGPKTRNVTAAAPPDETQAQYFEELDQL